MSRIHQFVAARMAETGDSHSAALGWVCLNVLAFAPEPYRECNPSIQANAIAMMPTEACTEPGLQWAKGVIAKRRASRWSDPALVNGYTTSVVPEGYREGVVKFFDDAKGWGFVTPVVGVGEDAFLHFSALPFDPVVRRRTVDAGVRVAYREDTGERGVVARNVLLLAVEAETEGAA